jgi:integrase
VFRKDGRWAFRVDAGFHAVSGKRRQLLRQGFATKRAAEAALAEMIGDASRGTAVSASTLKVGAYLDDWFETARRSLRPTTAHGYHSCVVRLKKHLGPYRLQALTPIHVQRCYNDLLDTGSRTGGPLSPTTVRKVHEVLHRALRDAVEPDLVSRNVPQKVEAPAPEEKNPTTWSSEEVRDFLEAIQGHPLEMAFRLLVAKGLRRGEVLGLRWSDVDFYLAQLSITHTITDVGKDDVEGPPKTKGSRRSVYLDRRTLAALREHRQRQRQQKLAAGPAWDSSERWVLTDELGCYIRPKTIPYEWRVLMKKLDLPTIRLHDLRQTHATLALKAGVHPRSSPNASATPTSASPSTPDHTSTSHWRRTPPSGSCAPPTATKMWAWRDAGARHWKRSAADAAVDQGARRVIDVGTHRAGAGPDGPPRRGRPRRSRRRSDSPRAVLTTFPRTARQAVCRRGGDCRPMRRASGRSRHHGPSSAADRGAGCPPA